MSFFKKEKTPQNLETYSYVDEIDFNVIKFLSCN